MGTDAWRIAAIRTPTPLFEPIAIEHTCGAFLKPADSPRRATLRDTVTEMDLDAGLTGQNPAKHHTAHTPSLLGLESRSTVDRGRCQHISALADRLVLLI